MKGIDFIILYEHFNREIENIALLKNELNKRGYTVAISHYCMCSRGRYALFYSPKVIITPWLRTNENLFIMTRFKGKNRKVVNLQWEQIYNKRSELSGFVSIHDKAKGVKHICWGERQKNMLINEGVDVGNIVITGAIQLDFGREEFNEYYISRKSISEKINIDNNKKWILYISSFSYATYSKENLDVLGSRWGSSIGEFAEISVKSRNITLNWIEDLLKSDSNFEFIYRPHPSEVIDNKIDELCRRYKNFYCIKDYSVKQWIKVSDVINTWYSTSIAEVYCMKKNCFIIRPIPIPKEWELEIMHDATFILEEDEFIKSNLNKEDDCQFPILEKTLMEYYSIDKNYPSYKRVADYLEKIYHDKNYITDCTFDNKELTEFKKKHKNDVISSLIADLISYTGIKFSLFIPFKKKALRHIENYVLGVNKKTIEVFNKIDRVVGKYEENK